MDFWSLETLVFMTAGGLLGLAAVLVMANNRLVRDIEFVSKRVLRNHLSACERHGKIRDRVDDLDAKVRRHSENRSLELYRDGTGIMGRLDRLEGKSEALNKQFVRHYHEDGKLRQSPQGVSEDLVDAGDDADDDGGFGWDLEAMKQGWFDSVKEIEWLPAVNKVVDGEHFSSRTEGKLILRQINEIPSWSVERSGGDDV